MNGITVVICAYNEEKNIIPVILETITVLKATTDDYEIILVDDGSLDKTQEVIKTLAQQNNFIKYVIHSENQGIGKSLLDGYGKAQKDFITMLPADGQISPNDIKDFYEHIPNNDLVVGYYVKRPSSIFRKATSWGVRLLLRLLFGHIPRLDGVYMFRRKLLQEIPLKMQASFVLNYEFAIRAYKQGYRIKEIPTVCLERTSGSSKVIGFKKIMFILFQILEFRFKY